MDFSQKLKPEDYPAAIERAAKAALILTDRLEESDRIIEQIDDAILNHEVWKTGDDGIIIDDRRLTLAHRTARRESIEYRGAYEKRQRLLFEKGEADGRLERLRNEFQLFLHDK